MDNKRVLISSASRNSCFYESQTAKLECAERIVESPLIALFPHPPFNEVMKQEQRKVEQTSRPSFNNRPKTQNREKERRRKQIAKGMIKVTE
ncbi:MAG: hypothetical protein ACYC2U_08220 [Candidatus Amoebophilus sp.]